MYFVRQRQIIAPVYFLDTGKLMPQCTRAPNGKFLEKDLKKQQSMNKASWSHFKHFGRLLGKKLSVPHSQQDWWKNSQPARCTYKLQPDLLGCLQADGGGGGLKAKFISLVGVGEREERFLTNSTWNNKSPQSPWSVVDFPATLYFQGHTSLPKSLRQQTFT